MSHDVVNQCSLALDRAVVERLRANPALLEQARGNLRRWLARNGAAPGLRRCYEEWLEILDRQPFEKILELLHAEDEEARRLRQNSPFVGILSPAEVWAIKRRFRHAA